MRPGLGLGLNNRRRAGGDPTDTLLAGLGADHYYRTSDAVDGTTNPMPNRLGSGTLDPAANVSLSAGEWVMSGDYGTYSAAPASAFNGGTGQTLITVATFPSGVTSGADVFYANKGGFVEQGIILFCDKSAGGINVQAYVGDGVETAAYSGTGVVDTYDQKMIAGVRYDPVGDTIQTFIYSNGVLTLGGAASLAAHGSCASGFAGLAGRNIVASIGYVGRMSAPLINFPSHLDDSDLAVVGGAVT
mgnify:CR=1 FL=1